VDPFSERFKQRLQASGGNLKRVEEAIKNGGRTLSQSTSTSAGTLQEGATIEHQRFGIGKVLKIEGTGENTKATVEFKNTGIKQLLLKFAIFNIIK
ncbi:MAG: ATP-dependent DNA helicase, partial [Prevotella sp.]|nr:ATP-dependent DNA helicase [Prevotella sp.]